MIFQQILGGVVVVVSMLPSDTPKQRSVLFLYFTSFFLDSFAYYSAPFSILSSHKIAFIAEGYFLVYISFSPTTSRIAYRFLCFITFNDFASFFPPSFFPLLCTPSVSEITPF